MKANKMNRLIYCKGFV